MIDLHSHILPGVDDGSKDLEMTRQMLEELTRQGVQTVVATPHFYAMSDRPKDFLKRRAVALKQVAALQGDFPQIIPGAEVAYFEGMTQSGVLEQFRIGTSALLLVEMPFCPWSKRMVRELCELQAETGLTPVLAHVDRYLRRKQFLGWEKELLEAGVLCQCNAEAFLKYFTRKWALKQLKLGKIHFLGSDAHNMTTRPPSLERVAQLVHKKLGREPLDRVTAFSADQLNQKLSEH